MPHNIGDRAYIARVARVVSVANVASVSAWLVRLATATPKRGCRSVQSLIHGSYLRIVSSRERCLGRPLQPMPHPPAVCGQQRNNREPRRKITLVTMSGYACGVNARPKLGTSFHWGTPMPTGILFRGSARDLTLSEAISSLVCTPSGLSGEVRD